MAISGSSIGFYQNLTNGVSQQPPRIRQDSQQDAAFNVDPTVPNQMGRRNPLEYVAELEDLDTLLNIETNGYPFTHLINRDEDERYSVMMDGIGHIFVHDRVTGARKTVTNSTNFKTIADTDITIGTGVIAIASHGITTGTPIRWFTDTGTLPTQSTGSIAGLKYVRSVTSGTISLHPTSADAVAGTNVIRYSSDGAGSLMLALDTYLFSDAAERGFHCLTYKDTTFVVNKSKTVAMASDVSASRDFEGIIVVNDWVSGGTYGVTVVFNGVTTVSITPTGSTVTAVATDIANDLKAHGSWPVGAKATALNNVVHVTAPVGTTSMSITVVDSRAGTSIYSFTDKILKTSKLPAYAPEGYLVQVTSHTQNGDVESSNPLDSQWYEFEAENGTFGTGVWAETVAPNIPIALDEETMPHTLTRLANGTFKFDVIDWGTRDVGDEFTNPNPLFVGQEIKTTFILGNRLGFLAGATFDMSRVGEESYYEFFRQSTSQQLDDDPVFGVIPSPQVGNVFHAIPWNGELILFGDVSDGAVSWGADALTQRTISITTPTRAGATELCPPVLMGSELFYITESGEWSNIGSYQLDLTTSLKLAEGVTDDYLGRFIPKSVKRITGREKNRAVALSIEARDKLFSFTYSKKAGRLIQQAVVEWDFSSVGSIEILDVIFDGPTLSVVFKGPGGRFFVGQIETANGAKEEQWPYKCYLDFRQEGTFSVSYDAGTDISTLTLDQELDDENFKVVIGQVADNEERYAAGETLTVSSVTGNQVKIVGDLTNVEGFYVGYDYDSYFEPNPIFATMTDTAKGTKAASLVRVLNLSRIFLGFFGTQRVDVTVTGKKTGREIAKREFIGGLQLDNIDAILDNNEQTFTGSLLVYGNNSKMDEITIRVGCSGSHEPWFVDTIAWLASISTAEI